jgi:CDP-diacylglycerol--serine O-phosphatidyltransferase
LRERNFEPLRDSKGGRKLKRSIYILPSIFTVGNIFAGFIALVATLSGQYQQAAIAIGVAVILDGLDGRVARLANVTSDFGVHLDSLADTISFGIAPAILVYSWGLADFGNFARFSSFLFLICGVMRLARFNVQVCDLKQFAGLPIPAGGGFIAATVHFFPDPPDVPFFKPLLVGATYLVSLLMISTIRYPSLKQLNFGRGKSHLVILTLALLVAGVYYYSQYVLVVIAYTYLLSGPLVRFYQSIKYRLKRSHPRSTEEAQF